MTYLNVPRLHFSGRFQAAPSTVNNDPLHFNNATFIPDYQKYQHGNQANGWWNPDGDAVWRLIDCRVTQAWTGYDQQAASSDPVLSCSIADSDQAAPAKCVDLDPEQQMVTEIWGMTVRICHPDGKNLLRAKYKPAAFVDIWGRAAVALGGDTVYGALWQSVLTDLEWGDVGISPFLTALKQSAADGALSIKFNVDGYNMNREMAEFTRGRITGTIGTSAEGEPAQFTPGRQLMMQAGSGGSFSPPGPLVNYCTAIVDKTAGKIVLDLGNAIATTTPGGPMTDLGALCLCYLPPSPSGGTTTPVLLGSIDYLAPDWYETTAGVVTIPAGRVLTRSELSSVMQNPLGLVATPSGRPASILVQEAPNGTHARADQFVFRLSPGETVTARVYATQWGEPYSGARIVTYFDPSQLQPVPAVPVAGPLSALAFPALVVADANGVAELPIVASDPGNPRGFIDGQVYGLRPMLEDNLAFGAPYAADPLEFISLLVWNAFPVVEQPTWHDHIETIFTQYANLYPVMEPIVDLSDYDSVCENVRILRLAFGLPVEDSNSMPVTRDLSPAKRTAILKWLGSPGPDGKPLKGEPKPAAAAVHVARPGPGGPPLRGGKAAALSRRLMPRGRPA